MPRNYLLGMFLVAILVSDPGHVLMQCTDKYCFDFSISLKYNICSTFSAKIQAISQSKSKTEIRASITSDSAVQNAHWVTEDCGYWVSVYCCLLVTMVIIKISIFVYVVWQQILKGQLFYILAKLVGWDWFLPTERRGGFLFWPWTIFL